jgi:arylsulfatase A-like enzyme
MVEHDGQVGQLLKKLDDLGIANNTIVIYTTDNGAEDIQLARRRHHAVPQREEHQLGRRLSRARDGALAGH